MKTLISLLLLIPLTTLAQVAWIGQDTHNFAWDANPPAELVQGYRVYVEGTDTGGNAVITQADVGLATAVPVSSFGLPEGRYEAKITAYNPAGESAPSAPLPFVHAVSAPGSPGGVTTPPGFRLEKIL